MLGSMVLDVFSHDEDFKVIATIRSSKEKSLLKKYQNIEFRELDVEDADLSTLKSALKDTDWIINCIGIIKTYIHDDNAPEVARAVRINALFPYLLASALDNSKVIQITTDCVYSGKKGGYQESDSHDASDVYGKTKSIGEVYLKNMYNIRCSIIGPELSSHTSLMDWFLNSPKNAKVNGYKNHFWNGVTTLHFAKICIGIIKKDIKIGHLQHVIPADKVSKMQMLKLFAKNFDRADIEILPTSESGAVDRTLKTEKQKINEKIWFSAGYKTIPTIAKMIEELGDYTKEQK